MPPIPLAENYFAKKPSAERGVPPPERKITENFPKRMGQKGLKLAFFGLAEWGVSPNLLAES